MQQIDTHENGKRSRIELCIDLFVAETRYVPDDSHPVLDATELSPQLELLASKIRAPNAWRAWAAGPRIWFLDGWLTDSPGSSADHPVLVLTFRDHDAQAAAAGVWRRTARGRWEPQQVLASSSVSDQWH
jgi:hypothetical protein